MLFLTLVSLGLWAVAVGIALLALQEGRKESAAIRVMVGRGGPGTKSEGGPVAVVGPVDTPPVAIEPTVVLELRDGRGKKVGTVTIPAKQRRATYRRGFEVFAAEREFTVGCWIYRRISVERGA